VAAAFVDPVAEEVVTTSDPDRHLGLFGSGGAADLRPHCGMEPH